MAATSARSATYGIDTALINALYWESDKCNTVMDLLLDLGRTLSRDTLHELKTVHHELHELRSAMLAFADIFPLYNKSISFFLNYLDTVLPSISKTLDDIQLICPRHRRLEDTVWDYLMDIMLDESKQHFPLDTRLKLYRKFFDFLFLGITQSPKFDCQKAEGLRVQIMDLRNDSGIPLAKQLNTVFFPFNQLPAVRNRRHSSIDWAIETADRRPAVTSTFDQVSRSSSFGPYTRWNTTGIPDKSELLIRRSFDNDALSFTIFINHDNKLPYILLRTVFDNVPLYECRPLSELRIMRSETKLHLSRWRSRHDGFLHWAVLHFEFFEELVVIHCTLLALKAQTSPAAVKAISDAEADFRDDSLIWKKDIRDNGVRHKLAIYRDDFTGTKRLYACVAKGEPYPAHTPAWTIFFSDRKAKPRMECVGEYKLIIYDASLYTFGDRYLTSRHNPRRFEIKFSHRHDNHELKYLFDVSYRATAARHST